MRSTSRDWDRDSRRGFPFWRVLLVVVAVLVLWILWTVRPGYQPLVLGIYNNLIPTVLVMVAVTVLMKALWETMNYDGSPRRWWVATVVLIPLAIFFSCYCPALRQVTIADEVKPEFTSELLETTRVRFTPFGVAEALMKNTQTASHLQRGDTDPLDLNGEFVYLAPRIPNGPINAITRSMDGFLTVKEGKALPATSQPFEYGEGNWFYRNILWQLRIRHYGCAFPEIFYLPDPATDGGYMGIAPYVGWRWHWITAVPYWKGVAIFHADGQIENLTVAQALTDPRLTGQRLFPEKLTVWQANAYAYKDGIINAWFKHIDQVEIPRLAHSDNQMPFLLPGNTWMVAAEPAGPSQSVFKIFFFDAHSGAVEIYEFNREQMSLGPNVAWGYAQSGTPGYVWRESSGDSSSGTYVLTEPRPVIKDGRLYWMYSVTTAENTGIALTILVGGENEILHFRSRGSLERWLVGEGGPDSTSGGECPVCPASGQDLAEMTPRQLLDHIRQALAELEKQTP